MSDIYFMFDLFICLVRHFNFLVSTVAVLLNAEFNHDHSILIKTHHDIGIDNGKKC